MRQYATACSEAEKALYYDPFDDNIKAEVRRLKSTMLDEKYDGTQRMMGHPLEDLSHLETLYCQLPGWG